MTSKLTVKVGADIDELKRELKNASSELNSFSGHMKKAGALIAATFTVDLLIDFGKQIIETTAKFQKFEAVLTNTLGSNSEAKKALHEITDFAAKTPFQVDELTESFVKLVNQGFKPTFNQMTSLGDIAASQGKSFDQLTEAIIDAQTGEFERLKEFGIRASKEGDKVTFTFKGVKQQVDFTAESIRGYILSLGEANGISGSMAAISETLGGKISNLQDSFDQFKLALGESADNGGAVSEAISMITEAVQALTAAVKDPALNEFVSDWLKLVTIVPRWTFKGLMKGVDKAQEVFGETDEEKWLRETDARIIEEVWGTAKKEVEEIEPAIKKTTASAKSLVDQLKEVAKWKAPEVSPESKAAIPDAFDPEFDSTKNIDFSVPGMHDPVAGIVSETTANEELTISLYDLALAREQDAIAQAEAAEQQVRAIQLAQEWGAVVADAASIATDAHMNEAQKLKAITKTIVDQFYKQAVAAVVANSAKLGPFGVAFAIAGLTFVKSIFSQLGSSSGGGATSAGGSRGRSADINRENSFKHEIILGGEFKFENGALKLALDNDNIVGRRTG